MLAALRGLPKDILFRVGPRLTEPGLRWAPTTMLLGNDKNGLLQVTGEEEDQATLTEEDGLLVCLLGIQLTIAQRPRGFLPNTRTIAQLANQNMLWIKDGIGHWYLLCRRYSVEEDSFLTDKTLCATLQEGTDTWVMIPSPTLQTSMGLVVELESTKDEIMRARSRLHVTFGLTPPATQDWLNGVFGLAQQLANSSAAHRLSILEEGDIHMDSVAYKTTFDALESTMQEIAASDDAMNITAGAGNITGQDGSTLIKEYIEVFFMGQYICAKGETPRTQQWCVD